MRKAIVISTAAHLLLIFGVATLEPGCQNKKEQQQQGGGSPGDKEDQEKQNNGSKINIDIIEKVPADPGVKVHKCEDGNWYGGIGVEWDARTGIVTRVPEGYPADKAGIRPGDLIYSTTADGIVGDPGTTVHITVVRNGSTLTFSIVRDRICTKEIVQ